LLPANPEITIQQTLLTLPMVAIAIDSDLQAHGGIGKPPADR
jgi:hypothetical protein